MHSATSLGKISKKYFEPGLMQSFKVKIISDQFDLYFLDRPEILSFIFYPRRDFGESRVGTTHFIEVEEGVDIG